MNRPIWDNPNFIQGNLLPDYPSSYNIGSEERPFKDLWLSGDIHLTGDIYIDEVLLGDGSALDPSLSFQLDQDTGLYRVGANNLGITTGGTLRLDVSTTLITSTLPISTPAGSAASPGLQLADTNTGFYNTFGAGSNAFSAAAAGNEIVRFELAQVNFITNIVGSQTISTALGAVGAPSYTFNGDSNTGIYSDGADQLAFTTAGVQRARFLSGGTLQMRNSASIDASAGSAAAPSLFFNGDSNSGFYSPANDQIAISLNGTLRGIATAGDIQITVPLRGVGTAAIPAFSFTADSDTGLYQVAANRLGFTTGGTVKAEINGSGVLQLYSDGTAAVPIISWNTDSDTGIYRISANNLGFAAGGLFGMQVVNIGGVTQALFNNLNTAASPAIGFTGDSDTGFYLISANRMGIVTGGTHQWNIDASGTFQCAGGSQRILSTDGVGTAPSYAFISDVNTGIFRHSEGRIAVSSNNTAVLNIGNNNIIDFTGTMANSTQDPTTDAPTDWVQIAINGTTYYLPAYVA